MTEKEMETKFAVTAAKERLAELRKSYDLAALEIARYESQLASATSNAERAKIMSFVIHYASVNVRPRLDLLAGSMYDFAKVGD